MHDYREEYRLYLMSLVRPGGGGWTDSTALFLFRALDEVPFKVVHRMDDNRIADAMDIRRGYDYAVEGPVTLLEIIIELSLYMSYAREKLVPESDPWRWFVEMIHNAGISEESSYDEIVEIGRRIVSSDVGLFGEDSREQELWMQLNRYLVERYHA